MQLNFKLKRKSGNKSLKAGNEMLSANDNYHHHVKAQIIKHLRELSYKTFKENYPTCEEYYDENNKCDVEIIIYTPTKRVGDVPNWYPTIKPIIDGLTDGGLWNDDNSKVIKRFIFDYGGVKKSDTKGETQYNIELRITPTKQ